jgi:hypothetical protein
MEKQVGSLSTLRRITGSNIACLVLAFAAMSVSMMVMAQDITGNKSASSAAASVAPTPTAAASAQASADVPKATENHNDKAPASAAQPAMPRTLIYLILIGITVTLWFGLLVLLKTLSKQGWSLKDALTEEAKLPVGAPPPAAGALPPMVPSSSRLIALIGTVLQSTFFIAIGYYVIWQLCNGQSIQEATNAWTFFAGGATLFLPYGINKATSVLS